ncbi:M-protein, striated muscle-like [Lycodopsis pacificus]
MQAVIHSEGKYDVVIKDDDLEGCVTIPGEPTDVHASEILKSYVVLSWKPPSPRGRAPLCYVVEKCLAGTGAWQRINTAVKLHSPRYPVFDLQDGQQYQFRVSSVNSHGSSEASAPSEPVQKVDEDGKACRQCADTFIQTPKDAHMQTFESEVRAQKPF